MPKISLSAKPSSTALQAAIDMLRTKERNWRKTGSKRALFRYLSAVFDLYATWKRAGVPPKATLRIVKIADLHDRAGRHPFRTLINVTSKADRRTKSRWTQALRYA